MSESPHPIEGAFAVCQHPYGEGVWWHLKDGDDGSECIQECGCTPLVAVPLARLQEVEGELEKLRGVVRHAVKKLREQGNEEPREVADVLEFSAEPSRRANV